MKRFIKVMFILALVLCFAVPAFAIKILPYNVPLQDLMRWDKYGATLRLSNPEGETLTVAWATTVDLWNYDGATWTFNLPSGDTFAFGKGVATTGASSFTLSSAATVGTIRTLTVSQTMTAAATANMVEALNVTLTSDVKTGAWANAIVGKIDYSTSGAAHGMAAAICAEMIPPDGSLARGALYALDLEFGCGSSSTWGSAGPVAFIKMENYGTASHFSTNAFLFHLLGETSATGDLLYNNTIKCRVGTTTWYLALSSAENSYAAQNAAGPVIVNEAATTANPTLCPNRAEDDTGIGWASNHIHIVLGGSSEYSFSTTTLDMNNNTITDVGDIICTDAAGPTLQDEPATTTNPTLIPNRFDETTGIGWNTAEIHFVVSGVDEVQVTALILAPGVTDSCALGSISYYWSDLFLASAGVINFNNDITLTHATDLLTFAGGNFRMGTTDRIEFRDATEYIYSANDGYIDVIAATGLRVNSDVFIGENLAGHGFTLYAESDGAYLDWEGPTSDVLNLYNAQLDSTQTDLSSAVDAILGYCDAGAAWTGGNMVGVRGKVAISGSGNFVSATGVWAGLDFATATGSGSGLTCALNAEVSSDNSTAPNAIIYIQSLPDTSADFTNVPYIVFSETAAGSGSHILFEVGHSHANTIPDIGEDELFYNDTLQIAVNENAGVRTPFFIPLSTDSGTFTTEYPILTSYAGTSAIVISGACTNAINITSTGSAFGLLYDVDMPTQIGANVEGIKVILERTADVVIGTSNIIGAEFIIKQGSDSYATGMAPQITGVRIAIGGNNAQATAYGLKCETQSSGYVSNLALFSINNACSLSSGGAVLYVRSYEAVAHALVKIEQREETGARGLYITDAVGTGTITDAIYFDCRNSTSVFRFATGTGPLSIVADSMTANPQGDVEAGYLTVYVGANAYQIPIYAE